MVHGTQCSDEVVFDVLRITTLTVPDTNVCLLIVDSEEVSVQIQYWGISQCVLSYFNNRMYGG